MTARVVERQSNDPRPLNQGAWLVKEREAFIIREQPSIERDAHHNVVTEEGVKFTKRDGRRLDRFRAARKERRKRLYPGKPHFRWSAVQRTYVKRAK